MKHLFAASLIALLVVLMFGCSQFDNPADPSTRSTARPSELMKSPNRLLDFPTMAIDRDTLAAPVQWAVPLPADVPLAQTSISAELGANIQFASTLYLSNGDTVSVSGKLEVPAGALGTDTAISMSLDAHSTAIRFAPEGLVFNAPLHLDWKIRGLRNLPAGSIIGFCYDDERGTLVKMPVTNINTSTAGMLHLVKGEVPHFSRYAFCW